MSDEINKFEDELLAYAEAVNLSQIITGMLKAQRDTISALLSMLQSDTDAALDSTTSALNSMLEATEGFNRKLDHLRKYGVDLEQRVRDARG